MKFWRRFYQGLQRYFVAGLLAFAPIGITLWATGFIVRWLDNLLLPRLLNSLEFVLRKEDLPDLPLVGALFTLLVILLLGVVARHLFGWEMVRITERLLRRVPVARNIYGAARQLLDSVMRSDPQSAFRRVVRFEYPRRGVYAIAFTTGPARGIVPGPETRNLVNVFVPTTPNPTSGFYLLVPEEDLTPVDISVEQAFKLVMSAGLLAPDGEPAPKPRALQPGAPAALPAPAEN